MNDSSKSRWAKLAEPEMVAALSAVVIGLCALVVAFFEVRIMRADQRSSVLPLVELNRSTVRTAGDDAQAPLAVARLTFNAENVGIGPAKIVDFRVTVDGKSFPTWGDAIRSLLGRDEPISYGSSTIMGRTIPPGRSIEMFTMTGTDWASGVDANIDRLDFEACFCSVFDECWTASYQDFGTSNPVADCRPDTNSFEE